MGMCFDMGNAVPLHRVEECDGVRNLVARWSVDSFEDDDAPAFRHECSTSAKTSSFFFTYSGWIDFCARTGLKSVFHDPDTGIFRPINGDESRGCNLIERGHLREVRAALDRLRATATLPAGYHSEPLWSDGMKAPIDLESGREYVLVEGKWDHPAPTRDPALADLIKLAWWMDWVLDNCETPAVEYFF